MNKYVVYKNYYGTKSGVLNMLSFEYKGDINFFNSDGYLYFFGTRNRKKTQIKFTIQSSEYPINIFGDKAFYIL